MRRRIRRTILHFHPSLPLDVVVATTHFDYGTGFKHPATGLGQLVGIVEATRFLSATYKGKQIRPHLSANIKDKLTSDLLLLGSPKTNSLSGVILDLMGIAFVPDGGVVSVPGYSVEGFDEDEIEGVPQKDLGLILLAPNPGAPRRRVVLCCGFSTYGTGATATFLFDSAERIVTRGFWKGLGLPRPDFKRDAFGLVVEITFTAGTGQHLWCLPKAGFVLPPVA